MSKKRKVSGLSGVELSQAYNSLLQLRNAFASEEVDDEDEDEQMSKLEVFEQQMDTMLRLMESKLNEPKVALSSMTLGILEDQLKIFHVGDLQLKPNHAERIASSKLLGQDEHMSPQNMQRHLSMLSTLVPRTVR